MGVQEIFYYIASAGIVVGIILLGFATFELVQTLRHVRHVVRDVEDTTHDVSMVKNSLKAGILSMLVNMLGNSKKGGETYGRV